MVAYGGADTLNMTLKTGTVIKGPGKIIGVFDTTGVDLAVNAEIAIGISAGASSRTAAGALQTTVGATVSMLPLGGVHYVQAKAGDAFNPGDLVYVDAAGLATITTTSRKILGIFVGEPIAATAALVQNGVGDSGLSEGQMIPVMTAGADTA